MNVDVKSDNVKHYHRYLFIGRDMEASNMKDYTNRGKEEIKILYCPRCGLRIPKIKGLLSQFTICPSCGTRLILEGSLPYTSRSHLLTQGYYFHLQKKVVLNENRSRIERWY